MEPSTRTDSSSVMFCMIGADLLGDMEANMLESCAIFAWYCSSLSFFSSLDFSSPINPILQIRYFLFQLRFCPEAVLSCDLAASSSP